MIYIKKKFMDGVTAKIELDEDAELYTRCMECGALVEATDEILDDFSDFLFGSCGIICAKCVAKRKQKDVFAK